MDVSVIIFFSPFLCLTFGQLAPAPDPIPIGFPDVWNGDKYKDAACQIVQAPPTWVDGFLFAQTSGSYGDQSAPAGQKMTHLFDAVSGVSLYEISSKHADFTGVYYPSKMYKIWDFYDRNMTASKIAWANLYTPIDTQAFKDWSKMHTKYSETTVDLPNVDFWKIGHDMVAGTESWDLGLQFDVETAENMRQYPFDDRDNKLVGRNGQPYFPIHAPMHEGVEPDTGRIWHTVLTINPIASPITFHQAVFTVEPNGYRQVQGVYNFTAIIDPSKCSEDGNTYNGQISGDDILFPRYMHSMQHTINYVVLPMSSVIFNPCVILLGANYSYIPKSAGPVYDPMNSFAFKWKDEAPTTFLLFDKRSKQWHQPMQDPKPQFFTHFFGAYEVLDDKIYVDGSSWDSLGFESASTEYLLKKSDHSEQNNHLLRWTLDLKTNTVSNRSILPENPTRTEFTQINRKFETKQYKYGYAIQNAQFAPNNLIKIDLDDSSGKNNKIFQPKTGKVMLSEPYFAQRPGGIEEEDGVIVARGLDATINRTRIFVLDAKSFEQVGEIMSPYFTPSGIHERFYTRLALGLKPKNEF